MGKEAKSKRSITISEEIITQHLFLLRSSPPLVCVKKPDRQKAQGCFNHDSAIKSSKRWFNLRRRRDSFCGDGDTRHDQAQVMDTSEVDPYTEPHQQENTETRQQKLDTPDTDFFSRFFANLVSSGCAINVNKVERFRLTASEGKPMKVATHKGKPVKFIASRVFTRSA